MDTWYHKGVVYDDADSVLPVANEEHFRAVGIYDPRGHNTPLDPLPTHPSQTTTKQPAQHTITPAQTGTKHVVDGKKAMEKGSPLPYGYDHFATCSMCGDQSHCAKGYGRWEYLCQPCDARMRNAR